jgi:hypothetical protein
VWRGERIVAEHPLVTRLHAVFRHTPGGTADRGPRR